MEAIHSARAGGTYVWLVKRATDFVIVIEEGNLALIDPRGRNRSHAVDCWVNAVDLANENPALISTALGV